MALIKPVPTDFDLNEYKDIDDDNNNQPTALATKQDTNIPFHFAPEGSKKYFFINNWTEHHGPN